MTYPNVGGARRATADPDGLTLAAFNTDCPEATIETLGETLGAYLDIENVTTGRTVTDDRPAEFVVLHDDVLIDGALVHSARDDAVGDAASAFRPVDTLFFAGYGDRDGLRTLSHRIETLAWRAGAGNLSVAGQQRLAMMDDQWGLYASIADEGTTVHVFENAEWVPGDATPFVIHEDHHSLAGTWLVAFDGAGNDAAKGALLAEEREPDSYYGVWTVVPELVDAIIERVVEREANRPTER